MADFTFKIILVGQAGVGKTAIVRRYVRRFFPDQERPTIGIDIGIKLIEIDGRKIQLKIWDSAGSERFKSLTTSYYRNADAAILVYGIDDSESLYELQSWSHEVCVHGDMLRILVGNKNDLEENRVISQEIAVNFALLENIDLAIECSAKADDNINYLFHTAAKRLMDKHTESELEVKKTSSKDKVLKYQGISRSMENLFFSPKLNRKAESSIDLNFRPKKVHLLRRLCTIL